MATSPYTGYQGYGGITDALLGKKKKGPAEAYAQGMGLSPDLAALQGNVASTREIADLLTDRAMNRESTNLVSGAAQLGEALLARRARKKADTAEADYAGQADAGRQAMIDALLGAGQYTPQQEALVRMGAPGAQEAITDQAFAVPETPEYYAPVPTDSGFAQFSKDGSDPRQFEGMAPAQDPTKYSFEQIGEEIYAIDPTNPENRMLVGAAPKKTPLATTTINMPDDKRESSFAVEVGKNAANNLNTILEEGKVANNSIAKADMMESLLDEIDYTGFGGNTLLASQRVLKALGIETGDDIGAKEAVSALTKEMGLALKQDLPGPMSNADREFLMSIPPGINVTDAGNDALLFMYRARNQYASELSNYMYEVNPRSEQEYNDAVRKFNMEYGAIFSDEDKRDLMAALTGTSP
ncbi:hypothetical protein [Hyphomonas sp.]|uniref:hypothetical protein n=1 Tax=Hyphomonas sp. TaxID=87 RepID=UPI003001B1D2